MKKFVLVVVILFTIFFSTSLVGAFFGLELSESKLSPNKVLSLGDKYSFKKIEVKNIGDEEVDVTVDIVAGSEKKNSVKKEWLTVSSMEFSLKAEEKKDVTFDLKIPYGADVGDYFSYVYFTAKPKSSEESEEEAYYGFANYMSNEESVSGSELSFSVKPQGIWGWFVYYINWFLNLKSPWTHYLTYMLGTVFVSLFSVSVYLLVKRFVKGFPRLSK